MAERRDDDRRQGEGPGKRFSGPFGCHSGELRGDSRGNGPVIGWGFRPPKRPDESVAIIQAGGCC